MGARRTLASRNFASKQQLDEAQTALSKAEADLSLTRAIYAEDQAGPTKEERAIAEAKVALSEDHQFAPSRATQPRSGEAGLSIGPLGKRQIGGRGFDGSLALRDHLGARAWRVARRRRLMPPRLHGVS
jgi:hypothetical protein